MRDEGRWLVLVDGVVVLESCTRANAEYGAGRLSWSGVVALAQVGNASALRWFLRGREVSYA